MRVLTTNLFEVVFYSIMTIISTSLFITAFIQGFILQITLYDTTAAFFHYFGALLALIATSFVMVRAKRVIGVLSRSDFVEQLLGR